MRFEPLILVSLIAFSSSVSLAEDSADHSMTEVIWQPVFRNGVPLEAMHGTWEARGYGYEFDVSQAGVRMFSVCQAGVWEHSLEGISGVLYRPGESADECTITLHPLIPGYRLTRIQESPRRPARLKGWKPTEVFDVFAATMAELYPFFEVRGIDWQSRVEEHRPKVSDEITEHELFDVMAAMLSGLNDGHTRLAADDGGRAGGGAKNTVAGVRAAFESQSRVRDEHEFWMEWVKSVNRDIEDKVLDGNPSYACNKQIIWGRPDQRIGYMAIQRMADYSDGDLDGQLKALHEGLDKVLTDLADTDALVIDVSMNPGGMDMLALEVASRFADGRRLGFTKWPATASEYRNDRYVIPYASKNPDGVMYDKPVYLVTSDLTVSAAEVFTMCMRAFPQVKTVGQRTAGALSDVLDKTLPNGWEFGMSNEIYVDHQGVCHEGVGIPPSVNVEIFDTAKPLHLIHAESIGKTVAMAKNELDGMPR